MKYRFPHIEHLDQVKEAIKDRKEFIVAEREEFIVLNYIVQMIDTFPAPTTKDPELNRMYALRRECRGLKFDMDGQVIARPFHKFFNLNEKPETSDKNVDLSEGFTILDKLDGSMIHPLPVGKDGLLWSTKMGITDIGIAASAYASTNEGYDEAANDAAFFGITPIFEYCSRMNKIVVDYPEEQLVLTAMRYNVTGEYVDYDTMEAFADIHDIPVVRRWTGAFESLGDFVTEITARENEEGYVLRRPDGHMMKMKNEWYVALHKAKGLIQFEKDVISIVVDDRDDDLVVLLDEPDADRLKSFANAMRSNMSATAERLSWVTRAARDNLNNSKKRFATEIVPQHHKSEHAALFRIWDYDDNALKIIKDVVRKGCSSGTKVEGIRPLIGYIHWKNF